MDWQFCKLEQTESNKGKTKGKSASLRENKIQEINQKYHHTLSHSPFQKPKNRPQICHWDSTHWRNSKFKKNLMTNLIQCTRKNIVNAKIIYRKLNKHTAHCKNRLLSTDWCSGITCIFIFCKFTCGLWQTSLCTRHPH